jgi:hypothetical protein
MATRPSNRSGAAEEVVAPGSGAAAMIARSTLPNAPDGHRSGTSSGGRNSPPALRHERSRAAHRWRAFERPTRAATIWHVRLRARAIELVRVDSRADSGLRVAVCVWAQ